MPELRYTRDARSVLAAARTSAVELKKPYIGTEHVLLGLLEKAPALFPGEAAVEDLMDRARALGGPPMCEPESRFGETLPYTSLTKEVFKAAQLDASERGASAVDTSHLLAALVLDKGIAGKILKQSGFQWDWTASKASSTDRRDAVLELVQVDDESEMPYYEQIVVRIKEAVAAGDLRPGDRLPSVRALADHLELAPGTVARAFALLEQESVVETAGPRGTTIALPKRAHRQSSENRIGELAGLLRPVVVSAFHLGGSAEELFEALRIAVAGVFEDPIGFEKNSA